MKILTAPEPVSPHLDLFLAGGITNCPEWQNDAIALIEEKHPDNDLLIANPRRKYAFEWTGEVADEQITWEHNALSKAHRVLFWFPMETLCPITLLELGKFLMKPSVSIYVGTHPEYKRRFDVIKQLELERPEVLVHSDIESVIDDYLGDI